MARLHGEDWTETRVTALPILGPARRGSRDKVIKSRLTILVWQNHWPARNKKHCIYTQLGSLRESVVLFFVQHLC